MFKTALNTVVTKLIPTEEAIVRSLIIGGIAGSVCGSYVELNNPISPARIAAGADAWVQ
jgi:hypothetical protein